MHLRSEFEDAAIHGCVAAMWHGGHHSVSIHPSAILFPGVYLGPNVTIGANCVIGPNAMIGAPGFGYDHLPDGSWQYRSHTAGVVIEDDVHIGAGANVAQGRHRATRIKSGARIDALCHVAHNVIVGRNVAIAASSMLAGSVEIGEGAYIAPSVSVRDHRKVGAGAFVGQGAVVCEDVPDGETWAGVSARRFER